MDNCALLFLLRPAGVERIIYGNFASTKTTMFVYAYLANKIACGIRTRLEQMDVGLKVGVLHRIL